MTFTRLPMLATNELVAVAWLGSIDAIAAIGGTQLVATTLPPDADPKGKPAAWTSTGFITVSVVGGSPDIYVPEKKPVIQVDCWATIPGSNRPPWDRANLLMETIRYATLQRTGFNRVLPLSSRGVAYPSAVVDSAYFLTEPHRDYSDAADYARYVVNLQLIWRTVDDVIP